MEIYMKLIYISNYISFNFLWFKIFIFIDIPYIFNYD